MNLVITETELPIVEGNPSVIGGRHVLLEATVNGEKFWRIWYERSISTLEKKRSLLRRDVELFQARKV
jgi:hypothetical protein